MAKRYRMTPARRAALKRAQTASARKRRGRHLRSGLKAAGVVGAAVGTTFVTYHTNRYIQRPDIAVRHGKAAGNWIGKKTKSIGKKPVKKVASVQWHKHGYL